MSAAFHAALLARFGTGIIPYLATQAFYSIRLFEIINYIEHYGLLRQKDAQGKYEIAPCLSIAGIITIL